MPLLSGSQSRSAFQFVVNRDFGPGAPQCQMKDATCRGRLILHHRDGNNKNNPGDGSNWGILCVSHNLRVLAVGRSRSNNFAGALKMGHSFEELQAYQKERTGIRGVSRELEKSERIKPIIIDWIEGEIRRNGRIELEDAINSGAKKGGCVQGTVWGYIKAELFSLGRFRKITDGDVDYLIMKRTGE